MNMLIKTLVRLIIVVAFRTFLWGLVTANFTNLNLIGGLILSIMLPLNDYKNLNLKAIIPSIVKTLLIPMQMIKETIELINVGKPQDKFIYQKKSKEAMQGSRLGTFFDVLLITLTPMTLVTGEEDDRWRIHTLKKRTEQ